MPTSVITHRVPADHLLAPDERANFERVARELCAAGPKQVDEPVWVAAARHGWDSLPLALRRSLRAFRRYSGPHGCMLLRGVPIDADGLPPTPMVPDSVQRAATIPAAALLLLACGLGDPTAFMAEKHGALVQDVVPVSGKEEFQSNAGSVLLSFHTENAFHEHRPDYVMLLCLRADHDRIAGLRTACVREVLPKLSDNARESLFSSEFVTEPPPSFGAGGATLPHPVLFGDPEDPDLRVDLAATTPLTSRAEAAQAELGRLFNAAARNTELISGDVAIVDNRVTAHGRTAFRPRFDGADRWLQRTFVAADIRRSRDYRAEDGYVLTR